MDTDFYILIVETLFFCMSPFYIVESYRLTCLLYGYRCWPIFFTNKRISLYAGFYDSVCKNPAQN